MVKTITELIYVLLHILNRYVVEYTINAPFQYCPETFYTIGMYSVSE